MSKINKVVITEFGDESKLAVIEDDLSDPAAGEVQLSVEYPVVSGPGVNMRRGAYPFQREAHSHRVTTSSARSASRITAAEDSKSAIALPCLSSASAARRRTSCLI